MIASTADRKNPWQFLLWMLRLPEVGIKNGYRKSGVRKLLRRMFPRLREVEDDHNIGQILEKKFGGSEDFRARFGQFVGNNLLFTCLCLALLYHSVDRGVDYALSGIEEVEVENPRGISKGRIDWLSDN